MRGERGREKGNEEGERGVVIVCPLYPSYSC